MKDKLRFAAWYLQCFWDELAVVSKIRNVRSDDTADRIADTYNGMLQSLEERSTVW